MYLHKKKKKSSVTSAIVDIQKPTNQHEPIALIIHTIKKSMPIGTNRCIDPHYFIIE